MDDSELLALLNDLESDRVERKSSVTDHQDKICEAICAFANDLPTHNRGTAPLTGEKSGGSRKNKRPLAYCRVCKHSQNQWTHRNNFAPI